ncbi:hypothetical protein BB561_002660 [Smittium simulii]|uniref:Uncharacterized protein n=1 Tax=Smittium simulii TaxID=133385 RepID=A0A2T9YPM3_9FUNG|nr:hypothetical protein BB561_002660 [Smittium simulii]
MSLVLNYSSDSESEGQAQDAAFNGKMANVSKSEHSVDQAKITLKIKVEAPKSITREPLNHDDIDKGENAYILQKPPGSGLLSEKLSSLLPKPKNNKKLSNFLPRKIQKLDNKTKVTVNNNTNSSEISIKDLKEDSVDNAQTPQEHETNYFFPLNASQINPDSVDENSNPPLYYDPAENISHSDTNEQNYCYENYYSQQPMPETETEPHIQDIDQDILKHIPKSERMLFNHSNLRSVRQSDFIDENATAVKASTSNFLPSDYQAFSDFSNSKIEPSKMQKRKHNIMYLAFEAKQKEVKLKESYAQNAKTQRETRSKYGNYLLSFNFVYIEYAPNCVFNFITTKVLSFIFNIGF